MAVGVAVTVAMAMAMIVIVTVAVFMMGITTGVFLLSMDLRMRSSLVLKPKFGNSIAHNAPQ
jgi:hypothetical protein